MAAEAPSWQHAYCAPGHLVVARAALDAADEPVAEITEHPWLVGSDGVLLIREPQAEPEPFSLVLPTCAFCGWHGPDHTLACPVHWLLEEMKRPPAGPLITGLPEV